MESVTKKKQRDGKRKKASMMKRQAEDGSAVQPKKRREDTAAVEDVDGDAIDNDKDEKEQVVTELDTSEQIPFKVEPSIMEFVNGYVSVFRDIHPVIHEYISWYISRSITFP